MITSEMLEEREQNGKKTKDKFLSRDEGMARAEKDLRQGNKEAFNECEDAMMVFVVKSRQIMKKQLLLAVDPEDKSTERQFLSKAYHELVSNHPSEMNRRFPLKAFGVKIGSAQHKKMYPMDFKKYFFELVHNAYKDEDTKKLKRPQSVRPCFFLPSGISSNVKNAKVMDNKGFVEKGEKKSIRERAFKREDQKSTLKNILMLQDEIDNCTFEPNVGTMDPHPNKAVQSALQEEEGKTFVDKLGHNFMNSNPEVFKAGILKGAQKLYLEGKYTESLNKLAEGFNFSSIKAHYEEEEREKKRKIDREKEARGEKTTAMKKAERE